MTLYSPKNQVHYLPDDNDYQVKHNKILKHLIVLVRDRGRGVGLGGVVGQKNRANRFQDLAYATEEGVQYI